VKSLPQTKNRFICSECGYVSPKFFGRCPGCGAFNTMEEESFAPAVTKNLIFSSKSEVTTLEKVEFTEKERFSTGIAEFDRVLGGGLVRGSAVLIGGDPGIGKSTLLLEAAAKLAEEGKVLYISGEESLVQIKMRAKRLKVKGENLFLLSENNLESVESHLEKQKPQTVVMDSIQSIYSENVSSLPGSVTQLRECAARLIAWAKANQTPLFLVGHVTKSGEIAGPRLLEHMVDTVLYFEGEKRHSFRILRSTKNRFGSTNEIGVFEMAEEGLIPVLNPSAIFLAQRPEDTSGSQVVASMEGIRPVLLEVQALVGKSNFSAPRRLAAGLDYNRVLLMIAVLERKTGLDFGHNDVYVSIAGGFKTDDPALDLGVCAALSSNLRNRPLDPFTVVMGEIGLTGEVRSIPQVKLRLAEAVKMGFKRALVPQYNLKNVQDLKEQIEVLGVNHVKKALELL